MTTMITEVYEAFKAAGVPEDAAKAAASSMLPSEQAATKTDIAQLRAEIYRVAGAQTIVLVGVMVALKLFG
jgi:hypothetical protein